MKSISPYLNLYILANSIIIIAMMIGIDIVILFQIIVHPSDFNKSMGYAILMTLIYIALGLVGIKYSQV